MKEIKCEVINDLLPLYAENMVSKETKELIEEHISDCKSCEKALESMKIKESKIEADTVPLKKLRAKLLIRKICNICVAVLFTAIAAFCIYCAHTAPEYVPYSKSPIETVEDCGNNTVMITFNEFVTDVQCTKCSVEGEKESFFVSATSSNSANLTKDTESPSADNIVIDPETMSLLSVYSATISPSPDSSGESYVLYSKKSITVFPKDVKNCVIYYTNNDGSDDICIFGKPDSSGVRTLPRLVLGYYLIISIILLLIFALLSVLFRKKGKAFAVFLNLTFIPLSYIAGHLCIKGISTTTYSMSRDFSFIIFTALFFFILFRCIYSVIRSKKSAKTNN